MIVLVPKLNEWIVFRLPVVKILLPVPFFYFLLTMKLLVVPQYVIVFGAKYIEPYEILIWWQNLELNDIL